MPKMVSQRDFVHVSTFGLSIRFNAGEPTHVPEEMVPEVMERGCIPADELEDAAPAETEGDAPQKPGRKPRARAE